MDSHFMALAVAEARKFVGATCPNPAVGACIVKDGRVLAVGAHERAGTDHAEVVAIKRAVSALGASALKGATIYATLEPCNHQGRTPPCARAILDAGFARVVYGVNDANVAATGGAALLRRHNLEVQSGVLSGDCLELARPFFKWIATKRPWVVHKLAYRLTAERELSMIPESGATTFTSEKSLKLAHLERRKSDAILTGRGTVLTDSPSFDVRRETDHGGKRRAIAVVSRSGAALPGKWLEHQNALGHDVIEFTSIDAALRGLGERGLQRVLVEAGPRLSRAIIESGLWDERLTIIKRCDQAAQPDVITREFFKNEVSCSPASSAP